MFKSATIFKITLSDTDLETAAAQAAFTPCGPTQERSMGWVPPRGHDHGALVEYIDGQIIMKMMIETKSVPAQAISDAVEARSKAIADSTGRKPGKKERRDLKDDVRQALLPNAFPTRTAVTIWINPATSTLVVDSSSYSRTDLVVTELVRLWMDIAVRPLSTHTAPTAAMATWLLDNETLDSAFSIGRECILKAADESKAVVRYGRHRLDTDEVHQHIHEGKMPTALALNYKDRVDFVLTDSGVLTKLKFLDVVFENRDQAVDNFDADVAIATGELKPLIADLVEALGGEVVVEGGA